MGSNYTTKVKLVKIVQKEFSIKDRILGCSGRIDSIIDGHCPELYPDSKVRFVVDYKSGRTDLELYKEQVCLILLYHFLNFFKIDNFILLPLSPTRVDSKKQRLRHHYRIINKYREF
jgi:hypothetical protein